MEIPERSGLLKTIFHWLPVILFCLLIYVQSSYPGHQSIPDVLFADKILHLLGYGLLGILFYRAYETLRFKENRILLILISIVSTTLYGISDEIHQYFVPYRDADFMDAIANIAGSICGVYLYHRWKAQRNPA
jgi:VanZ family protein